MREAVGALVICALNPRDSDISPSSQQEAHSERGDVRALRDLVSCVGAVKERIDEERGGVGDVPGVFVLVGARRSGSNMRAEQAAVGDSDDTALDLGVEEEGLGGGIDDVPFSVPWWEDQLFDMGLLGWEVVEWDPREQTVEASRNQMGGGYPFLPSSLSSFLGPLWFSADCCPRIRGHATHQRSPRNARLVCIRW